MKSTATTAPTATLLYLDASPRGERSHSRSVGRKFLAAWRAAHPQSTVIAHDIGREPPPFVSEAWVEGAYAPAEQHSPAARDAIGVSNRYVDELLAADEIVVATPIYNLSIPAALKAWIDQIVRAGRTFAVNADGYQGLIRNKRVIVIVASGGDFRPGTPGGGYNFVEPYLRAIFGFIGITQVEFVYAHSLAADAARDQSLAAAHAAVGQLAAAQAA
jgi:FMN-dependent NADH-azoreductase